MSKENINPVKSEPSQEDDVSTKKAQAAQRLMSQIVKGSNRTLIQKISHILNQFPRTRDSDITLSIEVLQTFYPEWIDAQGKIRLKDLYNLPKFYDIQRLRAKVQNDYGLFKASPEVAAFRKTRQMAAAEEFAAQQPNFAPIYVLGDESGKNEKYLIFGSIWVYSAQEYHGLLKKLNEWRSNNNSQRELHFSKVKNSLASEQAISFFDTLFKAGTFYAFKALESVRKF